jgi:hypothetical protein
MDGKNISDFVDPDIEEKLLLLEQEEEELLKEEERERQKAISEGRDPDAFVEVDHDHHLHPRFRKVQDKSSSSRLVVCLLLFVCLFIVVCLFVYCCLFVNYLLFVC